MLIFRSLRPFLALKSIPNDYYRSQIQFKAFPHFFAHFDFNSIYANFNFSTEKRDTLLRHILESYDWKNAILMLAVSILS